ncbi:hypothetical protein AK830_g686 [Neonectria ditissima]|uniref:Zn(2)-C6 fungal-type domain-containing protein n=1 Tax=Neonectria ditissima TaxID=78410 RepID=A0A0P7BPF8_9HYPO|nr:hypothetical protein AK830_g686 [Neonectria ditissima]
MPSFDSPESSHEASPAPLRFCVLCHKPFVNETSFNRHSLYCRRAHNRPRSRVRSCRACSTAKAKCSFQARCLRCVNKGLECVYNTSAATSTATTSAVVNQATDEHASVSSAGIDFTLDDLFSSSSAADAEVDMTWDIMPDEPFVLSDSSGSYLTDGFSENSRSVDLSLAAIPWPSSTQNTNLSAPSRSDAEFLARLPIPEPISHVTTNMITEMLLAFPQMMLRRETFPPFIHGHWYCPPNAAELSLPEPLANCMAIAQVFASQNPENKQFLWRTIKAEQHSFIEKVVFPSLYNFSRSRRSEAIVLMNIYDQYLEQKDSCQFSKNELLAAVQAQIMYIIMGVHDNSKYEPGLNLELLVTYQVLCENFRKLCNGPFCQDERLYPSSSWEGWILAESRRRTVLAWVLIAQTVRIKTGLSCDIINEFRAPPLPSPKSLWEARTRSTWLSEYEMYKSMPRNGLEVFGDLIDACKQSEVGSNRLKLNVWNAQSDSLGILLSLSSTSIEKRMSPDL